MTVYFDVRKAKIEMSPRDEGSKVVTRDQFEALLNEVGIWSFDTFGWLNANDYDPEYEGHARWQVNPPVDFDPTVFRARRRECSANEIMSVLGHRTLAEAERYTRDADQARLAIEAVAKLEGRNTNRLAQTKPRSLGETTNTEGKSK